MDILIATRTYPIDDVSTGREYQATDFMYRQPDNSFVLKLTTNGMPGEAEVEQPYSLEGVFVWLREMPEQVRRHFV